MKLKHLLLVITAVLFTACGQPQPSPYGKVVLYMDKGQHMATTTFPGKKPIVEKLTKEQYVWIQDQQQQQETMKNIRVVANVVTFVGSLGTSMMVVPTPIIPM